MAYLYLVVSGRIAVANMIAELFDDIPALETHSDSYHESVINESWSLYHEQQ